jgi:hypothetical protein
MQDALLEKTIEEFGKRPVNQDEVNRLTQQENFYNDGQNDLYQTVAAQISVYNALGCPRDSLVEALYCSSNLTLRRGCASRGNLGK